MDSWAIPSNLTPEQLASTPAGRPPPSVTPNLADPHSIGYLFFVIGGILMAVMFVAAGLRFYTRLFIRKIFRAEDVTTLIAIIGTCAYFLSGVFAVTKGKYGTHMWDLSIAHLVSNTFIITSFLINWITTIAWGFAKTTFLLMYLDIFRPLKYQRIAIYIGLFANWAFYIIVLVATLWFISPAPGQSWRSSFLSTRYARIIPWMVPIAICNLVLDVYILLLPIASVWGLQMNTKKKLGVLSVFATGGIACVASSLNIYYKAVLEANEDDFSYYTLPVLIMCLTEMCLGIITSCMPSMALLMRTHGGPLRRLVGSMRQSAPGSADLEKATGWMKKPWKQSQSVYVNMDSYHPEPVSVQTLIQRSDAKRGDGKRGILQSYELTQEVELQPISLPGASTRG